MGGGGSTANTHAKKSIEEVRAMRNRTFSVVFRVILLSYVSI